MNEERLTQVYQYALIVAGREDDPFHRELGPIHLLKYAYLADEKYAEYNDGRTYTATAWRFHTFGPWSVGAHALIACAVAAIGAEEIKRVSDYGEQDYTRWKVHPEEGVERRLRETLPIEVKGVIERCVHTFGSDTSSLLNYVYSTRPMLRAAPGDDLDFLPRRKDQGATGSDFVPMVERLSKKKRARLSERMSQLREEFNKEAHEPAVDVGPQDYPPTDVDDEVLVWVDSLAGEPFPTNDADVTFSDDIWRSEARSGTALE